MESIKIPLHGTLGKGKFALVDGDYDGEYLSRYTWYIAPTGYVVRRPYRGEGLKHNSLIYLHRVAYGEKLCVGTNVNHINGDRLDNRSSNLRTLTRAQIAYVRKRPTKYSCKYKGIWHASCVHTLADGTKKSYTNSAFVAGFRGKYIGSFKTAKEAAKAWDVEARKVYGEYGQYNFKRSIIDRVIGGKK